MLPPTLAERLRCVVDGLTTAENHGIDHIYVLLPNVIGHKPVELALEP